MPFSGSGYIYIYTSFGELPAWIVGWNMNLRFGVTAGAQSKVWASYMVGLMHLLGVYVPIWLYDINLFGNVSTYRLIDLAILDSVSSLHSDLYRHRQQGLPAIFFVQSGVHHS